MSMIIKYDFVSSEPLSELDVLFTISNVFPLSVKVDYVTKFDNVTIEFKNQGDAIRFTEVYLQSEDPADILEYVG